MAAIRAAFVCSSSGGAPSFAVARALLYDLNRAEDFGLAPVCDTLWETVLLGYTDCKLAGLFSFLLASFTVFDKRQNSGVVKGSLNIVYFPQQVECD